METKLRLSTLSFAAFNLTSALDHGFIDKITFDELYRETESGNLINFMQCHIARMQDHDVTLSNRFIWQRFEEHIHLAKEIIFTCYYNRNETETVLASKLKPAVNAYYPTWVYEI